MKRIKASTESIVIQRGLLPLVTQPVSRRAVYFRLRTSRRVACVSAGKIRGPRRPGAADAPPDCRAAPRSFTACSPAIAHWQYAPRMTTPAGWYPDPSGTPGLKYWDGHQWWLDSSPQKLTSAERAVITTFCVTFGVLAAICAISGDPDAVAGVAIVAVLVGAPLIVAMLAVRAVKKSNRTRANRRAYEAGLASRLDQQHQAILRGDVDAGVYGAFRPPLLPHNDRPDAEQMRRRAWQPDLSGPAQAVRPKNPAPWHLVTQFPTRQFRNQAEQQASDHGAAGQGAPR